MTQFFQFEADFIESLRCIPMLVRFKLDTCGVKLALSHWNKFPQQVRQTLVDRSCTTPTEIRAYREELQQLVLQYSDTPAKELPVEENPPWMDATAVPVQVSEKAREFDAAIGSDQWASLTPLQRFALIKLSRSSHENSNFLPACQEFNLIGN